MKNLAFLLITVITLSSLTSCRKTIHGSGYYITQSRPVLPFNAIQSDGDFKILITEDSIFNVTINAEDNIMQEIITEVNGGKLHIYYDNDHIHIDNGPVTIYISVPELVEAGLHGSGSLITQNIIHSTSLRVHLAGSGTIDMALETPALSSEISGSGKISLMGKAELADHKISGSGKMKSFALESEFATAEISGSGDCYIHVNQVLDAYISGSGNIIYRGHPLLTTHISGSGSVRPE